MVYELNGRIANHKMATGTVIGAKQARLPVSRGTARILAGK